MADFDYPQLQALVATLAGEFQLASRLKKEREDCGWSQGELSRRMKQVGVDLNQSSISKIEAYARSISVDELLGFSKAFNIPVMGLLLPGDVKIEEEGWQKFLEAVKHLEVARNASANYSHAIRYVRNRTAISENLRRRIEEFNATSTEKKRAKLQKFDERQNPRLDRKTGGLAVGEVSEAWLDVDESREMRAARDVMGTGTVDVHWIDPLPPVTDVTDSEEKREANE